ncbi:MAG: hypothetical protein ACREBG_08220 [Pyrinomonadaceae bacterium]
MYCPTCGNEITVELKYCNRCGANLSLSTGNLPAPVPAPVKLTAPTVVIGLTITGGLGIIFAGATELAQMHVHPAAITWMFLFSMATLFGCSAMLIRFWSKMLGLHRQPTALPQTSRPAVERIPPQQLPPRFESVPSVTEHTTRTFTPVYREPSEREPR